MSDTGAPQGRRAGARRRVRRERASAPSTGASEPLADLGGNTPAGSPAEGGAVEADASENAFWLASAGYQLVQMRQAAERQRAQVLDAARRQRRDLTDAQFGILTDRGFPLTVPFAATVDEVLAYVNAVRPRVPEPPVVSPRRLRLEQARRKRAVEAAHAQRPDLTAVEFDILAGHATLSGHWRTAPGEILAYVNAVRPLPPAQPIHEPPIASRRRLRLEQVLTRLARAGRGAPTQDEIAKACRPQIIDRTLRRWLHEEPGLYDLLPWLRAPRTK